MLAGYASQERRTRERGRDFAGTLVYNLVAHGVVAEESKFAGRPHTSVTAMTWCGPAPGAAGRAA